MFKGGDGRSWCWYEDGVGFNGVVVSIKTPLKRKKPLINQMERAFFFIFTLMFLLYWED